MQCPDDNLLAALAEDSLDPADREPVEDHLDKCDACRSLVAKLALAKSTKDSATTDDQALTSPVLAGSSLGRFVILEVIGAGAMGIVYAAYDPNLDRKVALKLLRPRLSGPGQGELRARMLREARALARISHPNVVSVYEVGTLANQIFLVMEFVDGGTLKDWLDSGSHSARAVLKQFLDAGRGLAAAHRAGLLHRDFKPENVLLRKDGRVCLCDFGLARAPDPTSSPTQPASLVPGGDSTLTRTGTMLGTPAYMSPEQLAGHLAGERSDQFSFCVALYEALERQRPFSGSTAQELLTEMSAGRCRAPTSRGLPPRVRRNLLRGLAFDPQQRFASMDELLSALRPEPRAIWKQAAAVASLIVLAGAGSATFLSYRERQARLCKGAERRLEGVWDGKRKRAVADSFRATGVPFAERAWNEVERAFDQYLTRWASMHREACEATRIHGEQSEEVLDLRMECLDQQLKGAAALAQLFAGADVKVVERAAQATQSLSDLEICANISVLRNRLRPPDPRIQAKVSSFEDKLARVEALKAANKYAEGLALLNPEMAEIRLLGHRPLLARALVDLGELQLNLDKVPDAEQVLREAAYEAEVAGDGEVKVKALIRLIHLQSEWLQQPKEARVAADLARATLQRLGEPPLLTASLEDALGTWNKKLYQLDEAISHYQKSLTLWERHQGADSATATAMRVNLALVFIHKGELKKALQLLHPALASYEKLYGHVHIRVAHALGSISCLERDLGQVREGLAHAQEAVTILAELNSPPPHYVATTYAFLGDLYYKAGDLDRALDTQKHVLQIFKDNHFNGGILAGIYEGLAATCRARGDYSQAALQLQRALQPLDKEHDKTTYGRLLSERGALRFDQRRYQEAFAIQEQALTFQSDVRDIVQATGRAMALDRISEASLTLGRPEKAVQYSESALELRKHFEGDPLDVAGTRFLLAKALWQVGRERGRAIAFAQEALQELQSTELVPSVQKRSSEINAWLRDRARAKQALVQIKPAKQ